LARKRKGKKIDGWLVIDKPLEMTSTQVVGKVRWLTKAAKVGHGGTLDPLASGMLPIALGEGTKTIPFIMDATKVYEFKVKWGASTTTDDLEGDVCETSDHRPSEKDILEALPNFTGRISQTPPIYSAIKVDGKRAYDLARAGEEVELKSREVDIHDLELLATEENQAHFRVTCGKGTYVRSLARDLAQFLGTFGHVIYLRRTKVGCLTEEMTISLDKLDELVHSAPLEDWILAVQTVLDDILALAITAEEAADIRQGRFLKKCSGLSTPQNSEEDSTQIMVRLMCEDQLVALAHDDGKTIKPVRVFNL